MILNLLSRFLTHIRFVGPQEVLNKHFKAKSFQKSLLAKSFEGDPSLSIIIGNQLEEVANPYYVTSSGWSIYFSRISPCHWEKFVDNPLSAIYIGAFAVGEVFKILIEEYIQSEKRTEFIYDFITHGNAEQPVITPALPSFFDVNLTLVGVGAVGQAIVFALDQFELRGKIILVDPDIIDESNLQRYPLAFKEAIRQRKTEYVSRYLLRRNNLLTTSEFNYPYEIAITIVETLFKMEDVFVSVDNKRTRINLQASLPKIIWNVWTDTARDTLRYGIGKHDFSDEYQCLACAYFPKGETPDQMELNAAILGMSEEEIRNKIENNMLIANNDLEYVFSNFELAHDHAHRLRMLIGRPFAEIFHGECGVFTIKLQEKHEPTPTTHIPVLAGTYAVIQYALSMLDKENDSIQSVAEFDGFSYPNEKCLLKKKRYLKCICSDPIYQEVYLQKWQSKSS
ncbi:MAG: ThiF family adenylyltransferase [Candidatus Heimdallarchaeota archaeon]